MLRPPFIALALSLAAGAFLVAPASAQTQGGQTGNTGSTAGSNGMGGSGGGTIVAERYVAAYARQPRQPLPARAIAPCSDRLARRIGADGSLAPIDCIEVKRAIRPEYLAGYSCSRMLVEFGRPNVFATRLYCTPA